MNSMLMNTLTNDIKNKLCRIVIEGSSAYTVNKDWSHGYLLKFFYYFFIQKHTTNALVASSNTRYQNVCVSVSYNAMHKVGYNVRSIF